VLVCGYIVWFGNSVGQWLYYVAESNKELVLVTVLVCYYIVWFGNSVGQCLYCVAEHNKELCLATVLFSYIMWLRVIRNWGW
jgi:hypothetical protein